MNGQQTSRVKSLYLSLVNIDSPDDREAYLDQQCAGDEQLRSEVMEFLRLEPQLGGFLEEHDLKPVATVDMPSTELKTQRIGPYKIREQLGEGGMGVVYVAEQSEPVRRRVALKIIKPGMDSREVVARFEAERQALAMMSHPNIAKVFDGGTTDQGRPYFVMELVKGIPITEFCDLHKFDLRQRLELFATVCEAVQHAHMKGIIHRDLKPSNIIIELHDVLPVVKVIDFGIAKATNQRLTEQTVYTQFSQMMGTPTYMSPEQAQQSALDVDVRSDVYSLGVLLYELLTGTTPFDKQTFSKLDLAELRKMICEKDPPRPSARVSTLRNEAGSTIAASRSMAPHNLALSMQRELDWVVMKAIEKDRTRRYESASAFAADIRRYLDDDTVQACPPSIAYRARKFAKRNKALLTTASIVLLAMIAATGISAWYAIDAQAARKLADQRLAESEADFNRAIEVVDMVINQVGSEEFARIPGMVVVRDEVLQSAMTVFEEIVAAHGDDPLARERIGDVYARLQTIYRNMGLNDKEIQASNKAIELVEALHEESPNDLQVRLDLAWVYQQAAWAKSDGDERRQLFDKSMALLKDLQDVEATTQEVADAHSRIAGLMFEIAGSKYRTDPERAELLILRGIELSGEDNWLLTRLYRSLASVQSKQGRLEDAERSARQAIEYARAHLEEEGSVERKAEMQIYIGLQVLAAVLNKQGESEAEINSRGDALEIAKQLSAQYPDRALFKQWVLDQRLRDAAGIRNYLDESLKLAQQQVYSSLIHRGKVGYLLDYARDLMSEGHSREAERLLREALPILGQQLVDVSPHPWALSHYASMKTLLVKRLVDERNFKEAQELLDQYHYGLVADHAAQARLYEHQGRHELALQSYAKALEGEGAKVLRFFEHRGELLSDLGRYEEAATDFTTALEIVGHQWHIYKRLAKAHFKVGDYARALDDLRTVRREAPGDLSALDWISVRESTLCQDKNFRESYLEMVEQALEEHSDKASAHLIHSAVLIAQVKLADAAIAFDKAMELADEDDARWMLPRYASYLAAGGHFSEQLDVLKRAIEENPDDALIVPRYHAALLSLMTGQRDDYPQICSEVYDDLEVLNSLRDNERAMAAWMAVLAPNATDNYEIPIGLASAAMKADPQSILARQAMGGLLVRSGRFKQAIPHLKKAISLATDPRGSVAYSEYLLAMANQALGRTEDAKAALANANHLADQELSPPNTDDSDELEEPGRVKGPWNRLGTLKLLRNEAEAAISLDAADPTDQADGCSPTEFSAP